jgi:hypothetical protein
VRQYLKVQTKTKKTGFGMSQIEKHLLIKCEALSSSPRTMQKINKNSGEKILQICQFVFYSKEIIGKTVGWGQFGRWKMFLRNKLHKEISVQSIENATWLLLAVYDKVQQEQDEPEKELT